MVIIIIIIIITIIHVENGKYSKTPTIATRIFCAFSRIVTGDNQFCRIRAITYKGLHLANKITCICTLVLVKLEYVLIGKASARLRK
jgi:DNA-binding XRE family transcriptional regulator